MYEFSRQSGSISFLLVAMRSYGPCLFSTNENIVIWCHEINGWRQRCFRRQFSIYSLENPSAWINLPVSKVPKLQNLKRRLIFSNTLVQVGRTTGTGRTIDANSYYACLGYSLNCVLSVKPVERGISSLVLLWVCDALWYSVDHP